MALEDDCFKKRRKEKAKLFLGNWLVVSLKPYNNLNDKYHDPICTLKDDIYI